MGFRPAQTAKSRAVGLFRVDYLLHYDYKKPVHNFWIVLKVNPARSRPAPTGRLLWFCTKMLRMSISCQIFHQLVVLEYYHLLV